MCAKNNLILAVPSGMSPPTLPGHVIPAHMTYRVGGGPHLFRANQPMAAHGGYMVIDDDGFDGRGESTPFCHEVMRECAAREFTGVFCKFEVRPYPLLSKILAELGELMASRGWPLYVTEGYGSTCPKAKVLISTALSGGTLQQRLAEAKERYGNRVALSVERVCQDFYLPSPTGQGIPLSREDLAKRLEDLAPSVFFSTELCAHYFTYMSKNNGAHFVLFDDLGSLRKKLRLAEQMGITDFLFTYPQVDDLLESLL